MTRSLAFFGREDVSGYPISDIDDSVPVHPILAQANFHPDIDYASIQPALRVTSLALTSPHSLSFLHWLFYAPRQPILLPDGAPHWNIRIDRGGARAISGSSQEAVSKALDNLSTHVKFVQSTPTSKVHTSCTPVPPTHGSLLQGGGYGSIITLPHFDLDELSALSVPHPTLPPDYAAIYLLSSKLVHSLLHELAHAMGHYTATQPSLLKEAFIGDDTICEFGFAYEIAVIGGTFDWVDSRGEVMYVYEDTEEKWMVSLPGGKERKSKRVVNILAVATTGMGWDGVKVEEYQERGFGLVTRGDWKKAGPTILHRVPFETIAKVFSTAFWQVDVLGRGVGAFEIGSVDACIERHDLPEGGVSYWLSEEKGVAIRHCSCRSCTAERRRTPKKINVWSRLRNALGGGVRWE